MMFNGFINEFLDWLGVPASLFRGPPRAITKNFSRLPQGPLSCKSPVESGLISQIWVREIWIIRAVREA
jgi:hypothetical protein